MPDQTRADRVEGCIEKQVTVIKQEDSDFKDEEIVPTPRAGVGGSASTGTANPVPFPAPSNSAPSAKCSFRTSTLGLYRKTKGKQSRYLQEVKKVIKPGSLGGFQTHNRVNHGQWKGIARTPRIKKVLYDTATMLGHISAEATQAAHYHVYRCLENGIDLGKMDYNEFWYKIFDAIKDLRYGNGLDSNVKTPLYDSLRKYAENAPLAGTQIEDSPEWSMDGHKAWRQDCLKAVAKTKEQNLEIILKHNAYHNLGKVIKVRIASQFGSQYADIFRSLVSGIAKAIWEGIPFDEVKEGYKRLQHLDDEQIRAIIKYVIEPVQEKFPDQAGRKDNSKMIHFVHYVVGEVVQYNNGRIQQADEAPNRESANFVETCMGEKLAGDIEKSLSDESLHKKDFILFMKHALDIFRQCSGSDLFTVCRDQGIRDQMAPNDSSRAYILHVLSERIIYGNPCETDPKRMNTKQAGWVENLVSELRIPGDLIHFDSMKTEFNKYLKGKIIPKLRSSFLLVEQRQLNARNASWGKRVEVPSILPLAKKRACHISIPNDGIIKLAEGIATEDKSIAAKIEVKKSCWKEAERQERNIRNAVQESASEKLSEEEKQILEQVEANKESSKAKFQEAPTGKRHVYKMNEEEKQVTRRLKEIETQNLHDNQIYMSAQENLERAKLEYQECCWASLFNIKVKRRDDGREWLFGGQLTTDGVDVSLQYYRLKTESEIAADEEEKERRKGREVQKEKESSKVKTRKRKRTKKTGTGIQKSLDTPSQGNLDRAKELLAQSPNNACVFDPGPSGHVGIRLDQDKMRVLREENKQHGDYAPFETIHLSNHEMRSHAGILKRKALEELWAANKPEVVAWKKQSPSPKVHTASDMLRFCAETNTHLREIYAFYSQNCFRRQRFAVYTRTQCMLDGMVEVICGSKDRKVQRETVVVFGNASINSGKHGKERICFRALTDLLRQRCCFIEIDEFRSSQYCCACHTKLGSPPVVGIHKRWKVRRCMNNGCERAYWQRDVNAAINLAQFFLWEIAGDEKAEVFRRPQKLEEDDIREE